MRKSLLMVLAVLLLPTVASAQYWGYNPGAHNPDKMKADLDKTWSDIRGFFSDLFSSSSSTVQPHTTGGAGYVPPVSSSSLQNFEEWCEDCQKGTPHIHPHTTGGAGYVPPLPSSFLGAVDRANTKAATEAQEAERTFTSPWGSVYTQSQVYGFCFGIYEASKSSGDIESDNAKAALSACDKAVDVLAESMNSCPNPETVAPAKEAGKSWWRKNVVDPYVAGYDAVGRSYMIQSEAMGKTAEEISDWFCEKWEQFTNWLCGD